jgi:hypothetical protein
MTLVVVGRSFVLMRVEHIGAEVVAEGWPPDAKDSRSDVWSKGEGVILNELYPSTIVRTSPRRLYSNKTSSKTHQQTKA